MNVAETGTDAAPLVELLPDDVPEYAAAIHEAGGALTDQRAEVLVWSRHGDPDLLTAAISERPSLRWVQLPSAGVENFARAGAFDERLLWTSAKGAYGRPVAEHALGLILAIARELPERARATSWAPQSGISIQGARTLIVGAGGIARDLCRLLRLFDSTVTVCRAGGAPADFADHTIRPHELRDALPASDIVVLAAPVSPETTGLIDRAALDAMSPEAILVNVGRGELVVTDDLVEALDAGRIRGAGLDVTDPEPLTAGHPLWMHPRALITPHTANTPAMSIPLLADRIRENLRRYRSGQPLLGVIDLAKGD